MRSPQRRSALSYVPGLTNNAVLQLIILSSVLYLILAVIWAIIRIVYPDDGNFYVYFVPALGLPALSLLKYHLWTVVTYGWFLYPGRFWELFTNMLWVYCFGSVIQFLVGHRQVFPLYIYGIVAGGICYILCQLIPGIPVPVSNYLFGPSAGVICLAAASVTLSPQYRLYLTEYFSIPLAVVAGVFALLIVLSTGFYLPSLLMLVGGAIAGYGYIKILRAGYRPGAWLYSLIESVEGLVTPRERASKLRSNNRKTVPLGRTQDFSGRPSQQKVDELLDKINQKGYDSLTDQERELLKRASQQV